MRQWRRFGVGMPGVVALLLPGDKTLITEGTPMEKHYFDQVIAEVIASTGDAIGLVVAALAQQLDATRLTEDLRAHLAAATAMGKSSKVAIGLATHALAAAEVETALRNPAKH
jgi:hypothetical protein